LFFLSFLPRTKDVVACRGVERKCFSPRDGGRRGGGVVVDEDDGEAGSR
jgi:hypothetical protein